MINFDKTLTLRSLVGQSQSYIMVADAAYANLEKFWEDFKRENE